MLLVDTLGGSVLLCWLFWCILYILVYSRPLIPCLATLLQGSLPALVQKMIAQAVARLGMQHLRALRSCNGDWMSICNSEITVSGICADNLVKAVQFLKALPSLKELSITGVKNKASMIRSQDLTGVGANFSVLKLLSGSHPAMDSHPKMEVENLPALLRLSTNSLRELHLSNCCLPDSQEASLNSPGFLPSFPNLTKLHLIGVYTDPELTTLDLSGCTTLQELECRANDRKFLVWLDVTGCTALTHLNCGENGLEAMDLSACTSLLELRCNNNRLTELSLSVCTKLKVLDCSQNQLVALNVSECANLQHINIRWNALDTLDLSPCSDLKTIGCSYQTNRLSTLILPQLAQLERLACEFNSPNLIISGGPVLTCLTCAPAAFFSLPSTIRVHLKSLSLYGGEVSGVLDGFQKLESLTCSVGLMGCIDLTGCVAVHLSTFVTDSSVILGRSAVRKLAICGMCPSDMSGFITMEDLDYTSHADEAELDLSACGSLRKVWISNLRGRSSLSMLNLIGCSALEELEFDPDCTFKSLQQLDLSSCQNLTLLKCGRTGMESLDVSCCPLLTWLDVRKSRRLQTLCTRDCNRLLTVRSESCPRLAA